MIENPVIGSVVVTVQVDREAAGRKVERAVELNRLIKENTKELDGLKAELRELAKTGVFPKTDTGAVEIRSLESELCATVTYPKDTPALIKEVDLDPVIVRLTAGQFDKLFRRAVLLQPTEKFEPAFKAMPAGVQKLVRKVVTWVPNTPPVNLSK